MSLKVLYSGIAICLTFVAFVPYLRAIFANKTRPHPFSWLIWGITTSIVFFAQLKAGGGVGAWPVGISGAITLIIALLAFLKRNDDSIKPVDWLFFLLALLSIPIWYVTADPLWAVFLLTVVDLLGFGPTVRKAYNFPMEENITFFLIFLFRNGFVLLALEHYSLTTVLFPLSICLACLALVTLIVYRRRYLLKTLKNET